MVLFWVINVVIVVEFLVVDVGFGYYICYVYDLVDMVGVFVGVVVVMIVMVLIDFCFFVF